jgi:hypothetical protein
MTGMDQGMPLCCLLLPIYVCRSVVCYYQFTYAAFLFVHCLVLSLFTYPLSCTLPDFYMFGFDRV